jgi:hypothetical protein
MAEIKTKVNDASVADFLNAIPEAQVRQDCWTIVEIMEAATQAGPRMWGTNIVGFGEYQQVYANGKTAGWMLTGFAPRKQNITLYIMGGFAHYDDLLAKLGKHTHAKACLYIKRLSDVDLPTLRQIVDASVQYMKKINSPA